MTRFTFNTSMMQQQQQYQQSPPMTPAELNASQQYMDLISHRLSGFQLANEHIQCFLLVLGFVGNSLGLINFCCSTTMTTPHFLYYKALTIAEFLYCSTYFCVKIFNLAFLQFVVQHQYFYSNKVGAYFQYILSHFVYSSTGYIVLYMSVMILLDRFCALWLSRRYQQVRNGRKRKIGVISIWVSVVLSVGVNSWAALFQKSIVAEMSFQNRTVYTALIFQIPDRYRLIFKIKDYYNMIIRVVYPFLLLFLTAMVIRAFVKHQVNRERLRGKESANLELPPMLPKVHHALVRTRNVKHGRRRESNLFYLMIAVVALAFVQVIPRETKRIFELCIPPSKKMVKMLNAVPYLENIHVINLMFTNHFMTVVANTATCIDRSMKFYLYMLLNYQFRRSIIDIARRRWQQTLYKRKAHQLITTNTTTAGTLNGQLCPTPSASRLDLSASLSINSRVLV